MEKPKNEEISMTLDRVKEVAKEELKRIGYPVENMHIKADKKNTAWQKFVKKIRQILQNEIVRKMNL